MRLVFLSMANALKPSPNHVGVLMVEVPDERIDSPIEYAVEQGLVPVEVNDIRGYEVDPDDYPDVPRNRLLTEEEVDEKYSEYFGHVVVKGPSLCNDCAEAAQNSPHGPH